MKTKDQPILLQALSSWPEPSLPLLLWPVLTLSWPWEWPEAGRYLPWPPRRPRPRPAIVARHKETHCFINEAAVTICPFLGWDTAGSIHGPRRWPQVYTTRGRRRQKNIRKEKRKGYKVAGASLAWFLAPRFTVRPSRCHSPRGKALQVRQVKSYVWLRDRLRCECPGARRDVYTCGVIGASDKQQNMKQKQSHAPLTCFADNDDNKRSQSTDSND